MHSLRTLKLIMRLKVNRSHQRCQRGISSASGGGTPTVSTNSLRNLTANNLRRALPCYSEVRLYINCIFLYSAQASGTSIITWGQSLPIRANLLLDSKQPAILEHNCLTTGEERKQGLCVRPRYSLNSRSSCLNLPSARITGMYRQAYYF